MGLELERAAWCGGRELAVVHAEDLVAEVVLGGGVHPRCGGQDDRGHFLAVYGADSWTGLHGGGDCVCC